MSLSVSCTGTPSSTWEYNSKDKDESSSGSVSGCEWSSDEDEILRKSFKSSSKFLNDINLIAFKVNSLAKDRKRKRVECVHRYMYLCNARGEKKMHELLTLVREYIHRTNFWVIVAKHYDGAKWTPEQCKDKYEEYIREQNEERKCKITEQSIYKHIANPYM